MNAIALKPLEGEILPPGATVRVIGKTHPLRGGRIERELPAGLSLTEILGVALEDHPSLRTRRDFVIQIDGHPIPEANWHKVRVKPGRTVTFFPRLQGGGAMRTVLGLVVAVAALIFAPLIAGAFTIAGMALTGTALSIATAAIAGGIILAGSLALNALFPVAAQAAAPGSTPLNSIQGAQNQANPFGPIPVVLGTHRQSPYYAAKPYTEIIGDDQYLRLLFCLGYGPLNISNLQIGETPLSSFSDYQIEIRQGFAGDAPVTLYPGEVDEVPLAVQLDNFGPAGQSGAGVWNSQTTSVGTDEISVDFTATQGISATDGQGAPYPWSVAVATRYRIAGSGAGFTNAATLTFTRSFSPTRLGLNIPVARGQYEVQTAKFTGNGDPAHVQDIIVWSALRSIKSAPPIAFPKPLALIALRIRATSQLSGVINTFNCVCSSLVLAYSGSGSSWTANTSSQNPADLFRWVLQSPPNARPRADALIDLANLQSWWSYCVGNGFKFNQVVNSTGSVYDKLCDIAASGRAVPTFTDGKWGVIWDRPSDPIVQHFTTRNSWGMTGIHPYPQQPHGFRVPFINELNGYTQDERIVYDDGYSALNATLFEGLSFPGVTDPALIWKHGRFHIAQSRLRPEKNTLNTGWENLVCTRGDRVAVTHDVLLIGLAAGRVKSVAGQVVTFDETVTVAPGKTYGMSFRLAGVTSPIVRALDVTATGDYNSLTLVGDLTGVAAEAPGVLFAFGETSQEYAVYRVQAITHQKDLIAALTLVDDAQAASTADSGAIPAYNPNITIPPDPFTLPPRDLRYLLVIQGQGAAAGALVRLTWQVPRFGNIATFEIQQRDDAVGADWLAAGSVAPPTMSFDVPLLSAGMRSFRVRCDFTDGTVSAWASLEFLALSELTNPLPNVSNLRDVFVGSISQLLWDEISDIRPFQYQISKGDQFQSAQVLRLVAHPPFATQGDGTYWVTAVSQQIAGVSASSAVPQDISIATSGSVLVDNVIASYDEAASGWAGTFTGGAVTDGVVIRTGSDGDLLGEVDFLGESDFLNAGGTGQVSGTYSIPNSHIVPLTAPVACKVTITWSAVGQSVNADFLGVVDDLAQVDFLGFAATSRIDVYPMVRAAQTVGTGFLGRIDFLATVDFVFDDSFGWGPWQRYETGYYIGLAFDAQMVLNTSDPQTIAEASAMTFTVDVPDRVDSYNLTLNASPSSILFQPKSSSSPAAFNGGPGSSPVPIVQAVVIYDGLPVAGDQVAISNVALDGLTIEVFNAGLDVPRNVHLTVQGF